MLFELTSGKLGQAGAVGTEQPVCVRSSRFVQTFNRLLYRNKTSWRTTRQSVRWSSIGSNLMGCSAHEMYIVFIYTCSITDRVHVPFFYTRSSPRSSATSFIFLTITMFTSRSISGVAQSALKRSQVRVTPLCSLSIVSMMFCSSSGLMLRLHRPLLSLVRKEAM